MEPALLLVKAFDDEVPPKLPLTWVLVPLLVVPVQPASTAVSKNMPEY